MAGYIGTKAVNLSTTGADIAGDADVSGALDVGGAFTSQGIDDNSTSTAMTLDASGNVGIGIVDPDSAIEVQSSASGLNSAHLSNTNSTGYGVKFVGGGNTSTRYIADFRDYSGASKLRLDGSGNLLVGKTSTSLVAGQGLLADGTLQVRRDIATANSSSVGYISRGSTDGNILTFYKDTTTVGAIGTANSTTVLYLATSTSGIAPSAASNSVFPSRTTGVIDNTLDLGSSGYRWNDAFIVNGVTTGSDGNDKQDIRDLTEAEQRVAVACKGLLKAWRWKSAVEEKGHNARIHCGIIAQDLQAAFAAEGLDAGRYAMFMSNTWWETQTEVPAVEAVEEVLDDDGNVVTEAVEAVDAYTRTDTYDTQEEAPEGATERTRLGVRYSELLAFIIGAL